MRALLLFALLPALAAGCSASGLSEIGLMPAPEVYEEGVVDPFQGSSVINLTAHPGMLYATDRLPSGADDEQKYYSAERGHVIRLGVASVVLGENDVTWEEARRVSLLKNRTDEYPIHVSGVEEFGVLDRTVTSLDDVEARREPAERFTAFIDDQLEHARQKDVFVYVHGFKVNFESPMLVAAELWHFLGYQGAFVAYSWPATPSVWAYAKDIETAAVARTNLRRFLRFLAEETSAERIHVIGYSAGTRVVTGALYDIALIHTGMNLTTEQIRAETKLGHVILIGSDVDRAAFGDELIGGLLDVQDHLTVYMSGTDGALGMSHKLFARARVGQVTDDLEFVPSVDTFLRSNDDMFIIDVTDAPSADAGNGHSYFRNSPWVSSDVLMTLRYGLLPGDRGLVIGDDKPVWRFPDDYIPRLRTALTEADPDLRSALTPPAPNRR